MIQKQAMGNTGMTAPVKAHYLLQDFTNQWKDKK